MVWRKNLAVTCALALVMTLPALAQSDQRGQRGGRYDQQILKDVQEQLQKKDKFKEVRASVEDGVVTLEGTVDLFIDKLNAEKRARNVDHVQGVRDMIQVKSTVPDAQLRDKLAEKLRYDRIGYGITFNNLTLGVNNGIVTIAGNVRDYPDRDSALAIVETTPGVKGVIDNIEVAPASFHDDEIRLATARAIYGDPALQKYAIDPQAPIRIVVNNGHVTLYGVVDSQMDKQIAETRAKSVPGVFSVDDKLVVASEKVK
jgi:osmotically-inducible protein OsmY